MKSGGWRGISMVEDYIRGFLVQPFTLVLSIFFPTISTPAFYFFYPRFLLKSQRDNWKKLKNICHVTL